MVSVCEWVSDICQLKWYDGSEVLHHFYHLNLLMLAVISSYRTELVFSVTRELLKVPSSSLSPPLFTPPNLLSLFSRYVDRQRLELLQEKLQWAFSPPPLSLAHTTLPGTVCIWLLTPVDNMAQVYGHVCMDMSLARQLPIGAWKYINAHALHIEKHLQ